MSIRSHERSWIQPGVALALFAYVLFLRTWHIADMFELLGDQMLYWNIALRPVSELPLGGGPSSVGGTTLGPAFIWTMSVIRHAIGPWTGNLPHAGGIGIALMQSAADAFLLLAIWKRFASLPLALAVTLLLATSSEDLSLSASIWNPPVAVAFVKISIASALTGGTNTSAGWDVAATAAAVLAVQCHSSAIFFAAPLVGSMVVSRLTAGRNRVRHVASLGAVVLILEAPFLIDLAGHPSRQTSPARVVGSVTSTLARPTSIRPVAATKALVDACNDFLVRPWTLQWLGALVLACAAVTAFRLRRDLRLSSVSVVPPVAAVLGFSLWQADFESYWFMTLMPSVGLTIGLALTTWKPARSLAAMALLLAVIAAQPSRHAYSLTINRLPEYGAIVRGSKEIRRRLPEIRSIDLEFPVPPTTSSTYIYERILGGSVTRTAPFAATIDRSGRVRFITLPAA